MNKTFNWLVHDRNYEAVLDECLMAAGAGEWKIALQLFHGFVTDIKYHMQMEDELYYPVYVEKVGDPDGEIANLSEEHNFITLLLKDLTYVLKRNDFDHFEESLKPLCNAMKQHIEHEEEVLLGKGSDIQCMRRDEIINHLNLLETKLIRHPL